MSLLLRKIQKAKWYSHDGVPWLGTGELQADALNDLKTSSNSLSFWKVESDRSNLRRVLAALAANGEHTSIVDYALFDATLLNELEIPTEPSEGNPHDRELNRTNHVDAIRLTTERLCQLAFTIRDHADRARCQKQEVVAIIKEAVGAGWISTADLPGSIVAELEGT